MKIKYCDENFLEEFKANFDKYLYLYKNKDNEGLDKIFTADNIFEGELDYTNTPLIVDKEFDSPETVRSNIKILFSSLIDLTPVQASQEKLWVALINTDFREYLFSYLSHVQGTKNEDQSIKSSIVFTWGNARSLLVQNLARLWWIGFRTYDKENQENPFQLMEFFTERDIIGKSTAFFSSSITNNRNVSFGIIEAIKELTEKQYIENKRIYYVEALRYFNLLGGTKILDMMTREQAKDETIRIILQDQDLFT